MRSLLSALILAALPLCWTLAASAAEERPAPAAAPTEASDKIDEKKAEEIPRKAKKTEKNIDDQKLEEQRK
ncbi:MAG: hypothetical protein HY901_02405 [Deltaproteobacteria bacterium]|nr:hypothetical protein [Deltaproteobacteria bacterium]